MLCSQLFINQYFFFNATATTEIYTLSLHDALPICQILKIPEGTSKNLLFEAKRELQRLQLSLGDRKSTRLNSSHQIISYAVFCLKKKTTAVQLRRETNPIAAQAAALSTAEDWRVRS